MKKTITLALVGAASALALSATAASAQPRYDDPRHDSQRYDGHRYDNHAPTQSRWHDDRGGWMNINQRQAQLDRRIDEGVRRGEINRREAWRLRSEFRQIAQLEARYRANGLSNWERADLDRRFDRLAAQIHWERNDNQYGYGYGGDRH